jgi:hypothetical protein
VTKDLSYSNPQPVMRLHGFISMMLSSFAPLTASMYLQQIGIRSTIEHTHATC